jgi:hypothetical protein
VMYENMDRLMKQINDNPYFYGMRVRYSTLDEYFRAVRNAQVSGHINSKDTDPTASPWPILIGDMLPYTETSSAWWTGFYTSRPALKGHTRYAHSVLRWSEQILAAVSILADSYSPIVKFVEQTSPFNSIDSLRTATAVAQHHDAVTGTARSNVVRDYHTLLNNGVQEASKLASKLISIYNLNGPSLLIKPEYLNTTDDIISSMLPIYTTSLPSESFFNDLKQSFSDSQTIKALSVSAYNSLPWPIIRTITIPLAEFAFPLQVSTSRYDVFQRTLFSRDVPVACQISKRSSLSTIHEKVDEYLPLPSTSTHPNILSFQALLPPLTSRTFMITAYNESFNSVAPICIPSVEETHQSSFNLSNNYFTAIFSSDDGSLQSVFHHKLNRQFQLKQNIMEYVSPDFFGGQAPGAYIMKASSKAQPLKDTKPKYEIMHGSISSEVRQQWSDGHGLIVRIFHLSTTNEFSENSWATTGFIEFEYHISPPEMDHNIVARFETDIADSEDNIRLWQTDSGIRVMERHIDLTAPVESQYFPLVSTAYIRNSDSSIQLSVLSSRSHGISRRSSKSVDVMLHRRHSRDDWRGLDEILNDEATISPKLRIMIDDISTSEEHQHVIQMEMEHSPAVFFSGAISTPVGSFRNKTSSTVVWCAVPQNSLLESSLSDVVECKGNVIIASPPQITMDFPLTVDLTSFMKPNSSVPVLARLHHLHDLSWLASDFEPSSQLQETTLLIDNIFPLWSITQATEMSLNGIFPKNQCTRTNWFNSSAAAMPLSYSEYIFEFDNSTEPLPLRLRPTGFRTLSVEFQVLDNSALTKLLVLNPLLHSPDMRELNDFFLSFTFFALLAAGLLVLIVGMAIYQSYCPSRHHTYSALQTDEGDVDLEKNSRMDFSNLHRIANRRDDGI